MSKYWKIKIEDVTIVLYDPWCSECCTGKHVSLDCCDGRELQYCTKCLMWTDRSK